MKATTMRVAGWVLEKAITLAERWKARKRRTTFVRVAQPPQDNDYEWAAALCKEFLTQCEGREVVCMEWNPTDGFTVTMYVRDNAPATTQINIPFWNVQEKRDG